MRTNGGLRSAIGKALEVLMKKGPNEFRKEMDRIEKEREKRREFRRAEEGKNQIADAMRLLEGGKEDKKKALETFGRLKPPEAAWKLLEMAKKEEDPGLFAEMTWLIVNILSEEAVPKGEGLIEQLFQLAEKETNPTKLKALLFNLYEASPDERLLDIVGRALKGPLKGDEETEKFHVKLINAFYMID